MDFYTSFGAILDLKTAENVAAAMAAYDKRNVAAENGDLAENSDPLEEYRFQISTGDEPGEVFIWSDQHGEPEHVVEFVCSCAEQFGLKGAWGLEFAFTSSRPTVDGCGGGAFFINFDKPREDVRWINTSNWLAEQQA